MTIAVEWDVKPQIKQKKLMIYLYFSQSDLIRDYVKEKYLSKVNEVELDGTALEVSPLPW